MKTIDDKIIKDVNQFVYSLKVDFGGNNSRLALHYFVYRICNLLKSYYIIGKKHQRKIHSLKAVRKYNLRK